MEDMDNGNVVVEYKRLQLIHYPDRITEGKRVRDLPNGSAHIYLNKKLLNDMGFFDGPIKVIYGDNYIVIKRAEGNFKVEFTKGKSFKGRVHVKRIHITKSNGTALIHLSKYHMHRYGWVRWDPPVLKIHYDVNNKKILISEDIKPSVPPVPSTQKGTGGSKKDIKGNEGNNGTVGGDLQGDILKGGVLQGDILKGGVLQ